MFVAQERRDAILAFAEKKFASNQEGVNEVVEVIKVMAKIDS